MRRGRGDCAFTKTFAGDLDGDGQDERLLLQGLGCAGFDSQDGAVWLEEGERRALLVFGYLDEVGWRTGDAPRPHTTVDPIESRLIERSVWGPFRAW